MFPQPRCSLHIKIVERNDDVDGQCSRKVAYTFDDICHIVKFGHGVHLVDAVARPWVVEQIF